MERLPTDAELEILRIVWRRGPSTVREVLHTMHEERDAGYTTVLKLMQIMTDKGLLTCDKSVRPQIYRSSKSQHSMQKLLVKDLLNRAFSGAPGNLILQALSTKKATRAERERIREFLDKLEEGPK